MLSPTNLVYFAEEQYQQLWFPAYGLLPRWHHARTIKSEKPAGLESLTLTFYQDHSEHRVIAGIMQQILASHQVTLKIKDQLRSVAYRRDRERYLLNSANFTLPLDFRHSRTCAICRFAPTLYSDRLASRRRIGEMNSRTGASNAQSNGAAYPPLADYSGTTQYAGLRMNTLGWFDFKSAWFAPPDRVACAFGGHERHI